ncbi:Transmembrane protein 71 [Heterocephalus glaber]|uniref:Transmembrane protein 71 n=1 Tax=Heterocephalus glaber TaxID=10181 RepID=G5C6Q3_HETGA|nr:Transmembrane protein 71 [Heterocephalus glaber]
MYRISQLMSTPVASKCSSRLDRECAGKFSTTCIFPRFAWDFLDGDNSFECCSMDPLTGSHNTCRQSPRLLTNGYYIWTEDSFLCDKDGNITLNPSQTRVMYKEKLVGIFRKKRRFCYSLSSLFNISASEYWLHGSTYGDVDTCPREGVWLEGVRRLDASHRSENDISLLREVSLQAILFMACFIISVCARWCMGGISANVFTCTLVITIAYVVKSFLLSLAKYFKAITCSW